jgi:hypothetical protein
MPHLSYCQSKLNSQGKHDVIMLRPYPAITTLYSREQYADPALREMFAYHLKMP